MSERWALITAGAQGLGGALTRHLVARGWGVFIHARSSIRAAEALKANATKAEVLAADLGRAEERVALADRISKTTPKLDLLLHNLGVFEPEPLDTMSLETFERALSLTLTASFHLTQLLRPLLQSADRGGGIRGARIVWIGDSHADRLGAHPAATGYHIAKLGLNVLARSYAEVLGPRGITANMISPGFLANSVGEVPEIPAGRPGRFEDITAALDYLLSEGADYVSGTNIVVSGGWNL